MLEPIISRPKLADKLLNMPPFRFLHDIVSEVIRQTGFAEGLYTPEEMDSANVKAKPTKIAYLEKLITLVGMVLSTLVDARPAKIVAGLEAENTNRLLQLLALAAVERPDSSSGMEGNNGTPEGQDLQRQSSRHTPMAPMASDAQGEAAATEGDSAGQRGGSSQGRQEGRDDARARSFNSGVGDFSAVHGGEGMEVKRSMRPKTARRRPPAVKDNTKAFDGGLGSDGADNLLGQRKTSGIMMEGEDKDDSDQEEDGDGLHGPGHGPNPIPGSAGSLGGAKGIEGTGEGGHTAMVQDILKEKERQAKHAAAQAKTKTRDEVGGGGGIRMGRLKRSGSLAGSNVGGGGVGSGSSSGKARSGGGSYSESDIHRLREGIQLLCQSTNPLGKCMNYVHEDLSLMAAEMGRWQALYKLKASALETEREETQLALEPLKSQLQEVDEQLKESTIKINGVKAKIAANDAKVTSLLKMVVTS
ncbi:unnamed protein product [Discosporangium mesarthrocarpum]